MTIVSHLLFVTFHILCLILDFLCLVK